VSEIKELKRYYVTIDHVTDSGMVHLTLVDSHEIQIKFHAICKMQKLQDRNLHVHVGKNFHLVIREDGEWDIYWVKNNVLSIDELKKRNNAFDDLLEIFFEKKQ